MSLISHETTVLGAQPRELMTEQHSSEKQLAVIRLPKSNRPARSKSVAGHTMSVPSSTLTARFSRVPEYEVPRDSKRTPAARIVRTKLCEGIRVRLNSRRQLLAIYKVLNRDKSLPRCKSLKVSSTQWIVQAIKGRKDPFADVTRNLRDAQFRYGRWKALAQMLADKGEVFVRDADEVRRITDAFRRYHPRNPAMIIAKRAGRKIRVSAE